MANDGSLNASCTLPLYMKASSKVFPLKEKEWAIVLCSAACFGIKQIFKKMTTMGDHGKSERLLCSSPLHNNILKKPPFVQSKR
jgi:hypothetical protein